MKNLSPVNEDLDVPTRATPAANAATVYDFTRTTAPNTATGGSGTWAWSVPTWAKMIELWVVSGGTGGGSGRRGAASTARSGGAGGGSGGIQACKFLPSELGTSLTIAVGQGGAGGAAVTVNDTNGNSGVVGGPSQVQGNFTIIASSQSGVDNGGKTANTSTGGNFNSFDLYNPAQGGSGNLGSGSNTQSDTTITQGGAGGGGISATNVVANGGGSFAGVATYLYGTQHGGSGGDSNDATAANRNGRNAPVNAAILGGSGSGGASYLTTAGGSGGNGFRGGGGGGGAASVNGFASGAGGSGGDGFVRIICYA